MVYAPDLCQVLWLGHTGPRLICPLALDVLHRDTHWAGTSKSGSLGISFPERPSTQLEVPEEEPGSSSERDTASRCHTSGIPASASYIADASFIALAFILASHYVNSPVTSRPFKDRFYFYSKPVTLKTFTERPSMQRLVPSRNRGYIHNLRRFFTFFTVVFSHPHSNVHYIQLYSCRPHYVCVILYKLTFQMELFISYMKLIVVPFIIYENVNKVLYSLT